MKRTLHVSRKMTGWIRLVAIVFSFLVVNSPLLAQSREVSGTVTASDDNLTIPGVNIIVKGTTNGTTTDANGKFVIRVDDNAAVLEATSIGYATQEIVVGTQSVINIVLSPEIKTLSEVVVIGYGTQ